MVDFDVTDGMLQAWKQLVDPLATAADVAFIESSLGIKLPADYVAFVTRYGFVEFGRDPERRMLFTYVIDDNGQRVTRQREVQFLYNPAKLVRRYRFLTTTEDADDDTRPNTPPGFAPIGSDAEYGAVMLDIAANPGQIWFWPESNERWGLGDNVALGFVADNFEAFISSLRPDPL